MQLRVEGEKEGEGATPNVNSKVLRCPVLFILNMVNLCRIVSLKDEGTKFDGYFHIPDCAYLKSLFNFLYLILVIFNGFKSIFWIIRNPRSSASAHIKKTILKNVLRR